MTRFPTDLPEDRSLKRAIDVARETLLSYGLFLHLASDQNIDDDVWGNVGAYMWACKYGLGIVENLSGKGINYNVVIELGAMLVTGRRCCILRESEAPKLPTDLSGQIYRQIVLEEPETVEKSVAQWAESDLGMRTPGP